MGKKDKVRKKVKGAEKTAEKTERKKKLRIQKATGEDDVEAVVKAIEEEERKRLEVKEVGVEEPSHRCNLSLCVHPDSSELVLFGGEFYNGQKTIMFNDLLFYDVKRKEWKQIKSPGGPAPRCSHQAVTTSQGGGQLWVFGGEYASPSESQFHHYKDLWVYHFATRRWEKVPASKDAPGPPSARSGHRMVLVKKHLVIFGGFNDSLRGSEAKYFNDVHAFDISQYRWKKLEICGGKPPSPRSGCNMVVLSDGRILVYGGYCKEKVVKKGGSCKKMSTEDSERGKALDDMFLLVPDKHDDSLTKWRWYTVKQTGMRPTPRSGMSSAVNPATNRVYFFGGVQDDMDANEVVSAADDDVSDDLHGNFFNELFSLQVENEKATWQKATLSGKKNSDFSEDKRRRRTRQDVNLSADDGSDGIDYQESGEVTMTTVDEIDSLHISDKVSNTTGNKVVVVEEGAFTISSTINAASSSSITSWEAASRNINDISSVPPMHMPNVPSPRFGAAMVFRQGYLYLYGGCFEDDEDRQLTLKDFYSLDVRKLEEWETLIESDIKAMEWLDSESSEDTEDEEMVE